MAYVGTPLDTTNAFQSLAGKRFNGDGSTTDFTLDSAPNSTLDIEVFVGNVRQDPNSAYTVSGTTLAFTGAPPSGTNNIYVVHQAKAVGTISIPDDTISSQTDIGGAIADADLFLIDDGGGGTIRKTAASRLSTYISPSTATDTFTINGSTPTLTIGDAGAEDTKVVFDGNAQDFHIGLDDSADDLVIGLGSALGTTTHMSFDETGAILKPLQPAFSAYIASTQTISSTSITTITFDTEIFDQNADFNTSNYTFTAPVTGRYLLAIKFRLVNADGNSGGHYTQTQIVTSNRTYTTISGTDLTYEGQNTTVIADMDASDTALVRLTSSNDSDFAIGAGSGETSFFGCLLA